MNGVGNIRLLDAGENNVVYITEDGSGCMSGVPDSSLFFREDGFDWGRAVALNAGDRCMVTLDEDGKARYFGDTELVLNIEELECWTGLCAVSVARWERALGTPHDFSRVIFVGLHTDGTVSVTPSEAYPGVAGWTSIAAVSAEDHYLLELKADGTAVFACDDTMQAWDVSHWHDVVAIDTSDSYCMGVRSNGTPVWAGDYGL